MDSCTSDGRRGHFRYSTALAEVDYDSARRDPSVLSIHIQRCHDAGNIFILDPHVPYLNLSESDRNNFVYRVVKAEHLYSLFQNNSNVLVSPEKWEDPFENFILSSPVRLPSGEMGRFGFHRDFYGQCWTLNQASDAMWRIYSPGKRGIRIRSTIGRLVDGLSGTVGDRAAYKVHIGRVRYERIGKLKALCDQGVDMTPDATGLAKTLLLKRWAFRHEREVRLLYLADAGESLPSGLFKYKVNPNQMIDQIMIDPRLSSKEARTFKTEIKGNIGFAGPIKRSLLYAPPDGFITRMRFP